MERLDELEFLLDARRKETDDCILPFDFSNLLTSSSRHFLDGDVEGLHCLLEFRVKELRFSIDLRWCAMDVDPDHLELLRDVLDVS